MPPTVAKLAPQKTGKDFLAASHFSVGMDNAFLEETKSTHHKAEFPVYKGRNLGGVPVESLDDSQIMHSSDRDRGLPMSQTKDSYQHWGVATREWNDYTGKLNTNFKGHSDQQCQSFETTAAAHFRKDNALKFDPQGQKSLMVSSVPMGDSKMVRIPDSEVRGNFKGQNVDHIKPSRYPAYIDYGIIDTLKTDRRKAPAYVTTNNELHSGQFKPAIKQEYGTAAVIRGAHSVGLGNETTPEHTTNVRDTYYKQEYKTGRYKKSSVMNKILGTTFLFGGEVPHAGTLDSDTTCKFYHTGASYGRTESMKPENVFESSFPEGDRHPERVMQLQNDTSYAEHYPVRAPGVILNPKVKGEEIITKSNVEMGTDNPKLSASTRSCYVSQAEHVRPRDRVDQLVKFRNGFSLGSLSEYREPPKSEIQDNFKENSGFQKFCHNPVVLSRLKDSHISLSHEEAPQYSTSYNSLFYKKDADPQGLAPKLQTSSLPLGTFSRYVARR